jgi:hypothetical protein
MTTHEVPPHSSLAIAMASEEQRQSIRAIMQSASPWPDEQQSDKARQSRRTKAATSFDAFDDTYFPAEMYLQGKVAPSRFHRDIVRTMQVPGVHVVIGPRGHGKTATAKKALVWMILTGRLRVAGVYCETLPKAYNMLDDIGWMLLDNPRITSDYACEEIERNDDQIRVRIGRTIVTVASFSEGRSVRGYVKGFDRPSLILCDDIETLESPMSDDAVQHRLKKLSETYRSLTKEATVLVLANNFDERCAVNRLLIDADTNTLPKGWHVHHYAAWQRGKPLWPQLYQATSEDDLRSHFDVLNDADWMANFQGRPQPPPGIVFKRDYMRFISAMPRDARGVVYTDPNLALRSKGDTTGIAALLYSPRQDIYILSGSARSYAVADDLLTDVLSWVGPSITMVGMDGHVSQESHWTSHIRAWCRVHQRNYPVVHFRRYDVDRCATNLMTAWQQGRVYIDEAMQSNEAGRRAIQQLLAFAGKRQAKKDDFPDAAICAMQLMGERKMDRPSSGGFTATSIKDVY